MRTPPALGREAEFAGEEELVDLVECLEKNGNIVQLLCIYVCICVQVAGLTPTSMLLCVYLCTCVQDAGLTLTNAV